MKSNNAKSIKELSRDARKYSILILIDLFRATMQQRLCQRRNIKVESEKHVTCYVEDIIVRMINKSKFWRVYQIDANIYEVTDQKKNAKYEQPDEVVVILSPLMEK
uniref:Uncharacterized protein n=1 Tax=Lactuca sativa TaxID=4236 RepID=A0A9R1VHF7_LACSA|nr:hypothetical protein LSAT_V11C500280440 [Lactuca sativa]